MALRKFFGTTEYGTAFSKTCRERCYRCKYKGDNYKGDIQIGDYWRLGQEADCYNELGTSCIIVRSNKGKDTLVCNPYIKLFPTKYDSVIKGDPYLIYPKRRTARSQKLLEDIEKYGLIKAVKKSRTTSQKIKLLIPYNVKTYVKNFVKKIPRRK